MEGAKMARMSRQVKQELLQGETNLMKISDPIPRRSISVDTRTSTNQKRISRSHSCQCHNLCDCCGNVASKLERFLDDIYENASCTQRNLKQKSLKNYKKAGPSKTETDTRNADADQQTTSVLEGGNFGQNPGSSKIKMDTRSANSQQIKPVLEGDNFDQNPGSSKTKAVIYYVLENNDTRSAETTNIEINLEGGNLALSSEVPTGKKGRKRRAMYHPTSERLKKQKASPEHTATKAKDENQSKTITDESEFPPPERPVGTVPKLQGKIKVIQKRPSVCNISTVANTKVTEDKGVSVMKPRDINVDTPIPHKLKNPDRLEKQKPIALSSWNRDTQNLHFGNSATHERDEHTSRAAKLQQFGGRIVSDSENSQGSREVLKASRPNTPDFILADIDNELYKISPMGPVVNGGFTMDQRHWMNALF